MMGQEIGREVFLDQLKKLGLVCIAVTGFFAFLGITLFTFSTVIDSYFPDQNNFQILQVSISAATGFITLVFYLGLFWLYTQIKNVQEMERRPLVEVADYSFEGDVADIWLSNYGRGSGTDIELSLEIIEPEDPPVEVSSEPVPLYREGERGVRGETAIPPEKELIKFRTTPALNVENDDGEMKTYLNWGAAVKPLHSAGIDEVYFHLRVNYSNQLGEKNSVTVTEKPRGAEVKFMGRLEENLYGTPLTKGGGATSVKTKIVEPVETMIQNNRLGDSSEKILKKISRSDDSLPLSEINIFMSQSLEERVCESLVYYELLEEVEGSKDVITPTGPTDMPTEYKLTEKGKEYLEKIGSK
jgi:hypothetical protein